MHPTVLISGATRGMGLATTRLLARHGYRVFAGHRSESGRQTLIELAAEADAPIVPIALDVQDPACVDAAVAAVVAQTGKLDILINNAGYGLVAAVEDGTDEEFIHQFDVNVFGMLRLARAAIPTMRRQGHGLIINVSSFLGHMGLPLLAHYSASKYAVEGITDALRAELRAFGIRVHTVAPGLFRTDFVRHGLVANGATTAAGSAYAPLADRLLPAVARRIGDGPDPRLVAEAILALIVNPSAPSRIPVGDEALQADAWKRALDPAAFEQTAAAYFGLEP